MRVARSVGNWVGMLGSSDTAAALGLRTGVLVGGQRLEVFKVQRDDEIGTSVIDGMVAFWQEHVLADVPPTIEDDVDHPSMAALLKRMDSGTDGSTRHLDPKIRLSVETLLAEQEVRKQADVTIETCKMSILAAMSDAAIGKLPDGLGEAHRILRRRRGYTGEPTELMEPRLKLPKEESE